MKQLCIFLFLLLLKNTCSFASGLDHYSPLTEVALPAGTYTVGAAAGNNFQTLEAAIAAINSNVAGPTTLLLTDPSYSITNTPLSITANFTASATLTIKPAPGVSMVTISGSSASSIFKLDNADYVTIDGSNTSGGGTRNFSIINTNTGSLSAVIWIANSSLTDPASHNTIKNCIVTGSAKDKTLSCIFSGGATIGLSSNAKAACTDNTFDNNFISKAQTGIYTIGTSASNPDNNLVISNNTFGGSASNDGFILSGIITKNQSSAVIINNDIQNIVYSGAIATLTDAVNNKIHTGLYLFNAKNSTVASNKIHNINITAATPVNRRCYGMSIESPAFNTASFPSDNIVYDNMICDCRYSGSIAASGWAYSGINANGGYGDQFYFNSVRLYGDFSTVPNAYAAFSNGNGANAATTTAIILENNIFDVDIDNLATGSNGSSFYAHYSKLNTVPPENHWSHNDLYIQVNSSKGNGYVGYLAGNKASFPNWLSAAPETSSVNVIPNFLSVTDLHLTDCSSLDNLGTPVSIVSADFDKDPRAGSSPDIGADEFASDGITWTGTVSTDWNTPENWCSLMVPSSLTNISIPVVTNLPVLNSNATARNIHIDPGASINLNNQTLTVNGTFSGSGSLSGSAKSGLIINTAGDAGNVYFKQSSPYNQLKILTINEGSMLSLGGNSETGDELNIMPGNSTDGYGIVTVNGTLNTNGLLILKSDANGTAMIGPSSGTIN